MSITDLLYIGYKKYKDEDEPMEIKNGYSLSFEDLRINIDSDQDDSDNSVDSDLCDLSDDWTPMRKIGKKYKKTVIERICRYAIWTIVISGMSYICYWTMIELYRE
jgi:hypothetical protein